MADEAPTREDVDADLTALNNAVGGSDSAEGEPDMDEWLSRPWDTLLLPWRPMTAPEFEAVNWDDERYDSGCDRGTLIRLTYTVRALTNALHAAESRLATLPEKIEALRPFDDAGTVGGGDYANGHDDGYASGYSAGIDAALTTLAPSKPEAPNGR